ncbi:MAG: hypothetical protein JW843_04165 [Candidatus Aminicenantes bacterium]|nr:hypothetical protein [Candidatus Aminicenantes bacterium]
MRRAVMLKTVFVSAFLATLPWTACAGQDEKIQVALSGGMVHIPGSGSKEDYRLGENDFPVTPARSESCLGLSASYPLSAKTRLVLAWDHLFNSRIRLEDPLDGDTVDIKTARQSFLSFSLRYQSSKNAFRPYLSGGIGWNVQRPEAQSVLTAYGYRIDLRNIETTSAFFVQLGGGPDVRLGSSFGLRLDLRIIYLFRDAKPNADFVTGLGVYVLLR